MPMDQEPLVDILQLKEGMTIKARKEEGGRYYRADVIDLAVMKVDDGKENVKVHWWGTKPKLDKWIRIDDCRFIRQFEVNWTDIKEKLPLAQDPESRAQRKKVFADWNTSGKSATLSLKELERGVKTLLAGDIGDDVEEATKATKIAWKLARNLAPSHKKAGEKTVDFKEFHAFIFAFRCYVEIAELFEHLDSMQEDDQKLSLRECHKNMGQLAKWGIEESKLQQVFQGLDSWTPKWKFEDFSKFCIEQRWNSQIQLDLELDSEDEEVVAEQARALVRSVTSLTRKRRQEGSDAAENRQNVMAIFKKWDTDYSGKISEAELVAALRDLDPNISEESAQKMVALADANDDGAIDYEEFCLWVFAPCVDDEHIHAYHHR